MKVIISTGLKRQEKKKKKNNLSTALAAALVYRGKNTKFAGQGMKWNMCCLGFWAEASKIKTRKTNISFSSLAPRKFLIAVRWSVKSEPSSG